MAENTLKTVSNTIPGSGRALLVYAGVAFLAFMLLVALLGFIAENSEATTSSGKAVDAEAGSITLALSSEPPQMDSTRATDQVSGMLLGHVMEGLLRYDENNQLVPGVAERWKLDGLRMTFYLRTNSQWSDGRPVTANDFVFAWRKTVDPLNASQYAFILFSIKNAEAINVGDLPVEALGVQAIDDHTLSVELERPTAYFLKLLAFPTYFPVNEEFYDETDGRYGANADDMIYNGPFKITSWVHDASVLLEKNEKYWNRNKVRLSTINFAYIVANANSVVNLFESGDIISAGLTTEHLERALKNRWQIRPYADGSVFFIEFNHRPGRLTSNWNLRKALQLVNDPKELVYKVVKLPGTLPGASIIPQWCKGIKGYFRNEFPAPVHVPNERRAREHLAKAMEELGITKIPPLHFLTGDSETSNKQSEYYQNVFRERLDIDVRIDRQIFKQRLEKMTRGDFDLVAAGWGPDYDDALTFGDLFASWNANNRGLYASEEVDRNVAIAQSSLDAQTRMEALAEVQRILYEDAAILMNYERGSVYVIDPRIKNVVRRSVGADPDYSFAYIKEVDSKG